MQTQIKLLYRSTFRFHLCSGHQSWKKQFIWDFLFSKPVILGTSVRKTNRRSRNKQLGGKEGGGRRDEALMREEALMSNICLISHHWYDVEKLTVPGSSTLPEIALLNFNSCFYKLSTRNSCFTTSLFTRFLFMVTEILRKVVLFCHHSQT